MDIGRRAVSMFCCCMCISFFFCRGQSRGMVARTDLMTKMLRTPRRCLRCCTPVPRVRASPETAADGRDGSERERNTDIKATRATMPPTHFACGSPSRVSKSTQQNLWYPFQKNVRASHTHPSTLLLLSLSLSRARSLCNAVDHAHMERYFFCTETITTDEGDSCIPVSCSEKMR